MQGDTTIGSVVYQKIMYFEIGSGSDYEYYAGAIRQDTVEKKVFAIDYQWVTTGEVVLYDFSKRPGDTVFVGEDGHCPAGGYYVIAHVDSILIGDQYRRTFHFINPIYDAYWIEGIGSTRGLFSPVSPVPTGQDFWKLTCFYLNEELLFMNPEFEECTPNWTDVGETSKKTQSIRIIVGPNPATIELLLQLPENIPPEQAQIELFNPTGKLLYKVQPASRFHSIETAHLPAGLYLVRLWDGERWRTENGEGSD